MTTRVQGNSGVYEVSYGPGPRGRHVGWRCTCMAFRFARGSIGAGSKTCKHVRQVRDVMREAA